MAGPKSLSNSASNVECSFSMMRRVSKTICWLKSSVLKWSKYHDDQRVSIENSYHIIKQLPFWIRLIWHHNLLLDHFSSLFHILCNRFRIFGAFQSRNYVANINNQSLLCIERISKRLLRLANFWIDLQRYVLFGQNCRCLRNTIENQCVDHIFLFYAEEI